MSEPKKRQNQRKKLARRDKLVSDQRKGYKRRYVNDDPGRIEAFKEAGWEIVRKESLGEDLSNPVGSGANTPVGGGKTAYLMEIREDWWKEDQADKEERRKEREAGLLQSNDGFQPQKRSDGEGVFISRTAEHKANRN